MNSSKSTVQCREVAASSAAAPASAAAVSPASTADRAGDRAQKSANAAVPTARCPVAHPVLVLMGLFLGSFTGMYSETACNIALSQLTIAFSVDISLTQWFVISYMLAIGLVLPFSSLLTKWFPASKLSLFALIFFAAGSLVSGFSNTLGMALTGRALQGAATGVLLPLMFSTIVEVVPPHRIGAMMGTSALVVMLATVIGPTLAGIIIDMLSWRWIFFSFVGILIVAVVFQLRFSVDAFDLTRPHLDKQSAVLSCIGFGGVVLGAGMASSYGWLSAPVLLGFIVGIVALVAYVRRQLASTSPILNIRALGFPNFRVGCALVIADFAVTLDAMYVLPQLMQNGMGLDTAVAGLALLPGGIVNCALSAFSGRIYDRVGARIPASIGFALIVVGSALFLRVASDTSLAVVIVLNMVVMGGVPLVMSPSQSYALASLPPSMNTDGSTILNTLQQVCGAIATAVTTSLMVLGRGFVASDPDATAAQAFVSGSHLGYLFALILGVFGLVMTFRLKRRAFDPAAEDKVEREEEKAGVLASAEEAASGEQALADVRSLMHTDVYTLRDDQTALDALALFADKGISAAPVVDKRGVPVGFVTDGNVMENGRMVGMLNRSDITRYAVDLYRS